MSDPLQKLHTLLEDLTRMADDLDALQERFNEIVDELGSNAKRDVIVHRDPGDESDT